MRAGSLDRFATWAVIVAAISVAASSLLRAVERVPVDSVTDDAPQTRFVDDWKLLVADGISSGDANADVTLIEFADFECSYCARAHLGLREQLAQRGSTVRQVFMHFPLRSHRFSLPSAHAAECANVQGRFGEMKHALFSRQDSLGLKSLRSYAEDAGVANLDAFDECLKGSPNDFPRIAAGLAAAERLRLQVTPTFIVNGWQHIGLSADSLVALIDAELLSQGR